MKNNSIHQCKPILPFHSSSFFNHFQPLEFLPISAIWSSHQQTLLGHLIPSEKLQFKTESTVLNLPDGAHLELSWVRLEAAQHTVILMHGLGGSEDSDYMRRTANLAYQHQCNVVLVNHRGVEKKQLTYKSVKTTYNKNTLHPTSYHSGRGDDASEVIFWARAHFSSAKVIAIGFSMSGSVLLNLLCHRYGQHLPDFALVINAPLNLEKASDQLQKGFNQIYDLRFYLLLKKMIQKRYQLKLKLSPIGTTRQIDELFTSQLNQFQDAKDYYLKCSTWPYLKNIQTPTVVLTAADDPFIQVDDYLKAQWSESTHVMITPYGGHMGYLAKNNYGRYKKRWLDYFISEFLRATTKQA